MTSLGSTIDITGLYSTPDNMTVMLGFDAEAGQM